VKSVDQSQCMPARYTVDLVLLAAACRSLEVHLANYSVVLENTTVDIVRSLNLDKRDKLVVIDKIKDV
jgi:hypothetical protein